MALGSTRSRPSLSFAAASTSFVSTSRWSTRPATRARSARGRFHRQGRGAVRPVSFARFYGPGDVSRPAAPAPAPPQASTSFASNVNTTPGRVVVIVIDLESMTAGYEKLVLDSASKLVDRLGPADAAGLLVVPGKSVDLTRDRQQIRQVLSQLRGFRSAGVGRPPDHHRRGRGVRATRSTHHRSGRRTRVPAR